MLKFIIAFTYSAFAISAHYIPSSYQQIMLYQLAPQQETPKIESWSEKPRYEWETQKPANYEFKYEVHDEKTGDIKRQSETASNGAVKGQYSLIDSDGFRRVVDYTADDHHGFLATVKREPTQFKIQPTPSKYEKPQVYAHPISWYRPEAKVEAWTEKAKSEWEYKESEKPANYDYKYEVHDEKTGDIKRHAETSSNGAVKGQYSLIDSDGFRRVVDYTADDRHGFRATVRREPTDYKVPEAKNQPEPEIATKWW